MSQNYIINETESHSNGSALEQSVDGGQNKDTKNTYSENLPGPKIKNEIEEKNTKNWKKRIKKSQ